MMEVMIADIRRCRLSGLAVVGLSVFCALHIIGARWIYSYIPYAEWARALHFPFDWAGERNHYDRLVHFAFGLFLLPLFYDISARQLAGRKFSAIIVAWLMIQTGSLVYELFEWSLTWFLCPMPPRVTMDSKATDGTPKKIWHWRCLVLLWQLLDKRKS